MNRRKRFLMKELINIDMEYKKDAAFVDRESELKFLTDYIRIRPESILFIHGPKSSGKTTLLHRFFDGMATCRELDVTFLNLREILIENYKDFLKIFFGIDYDKSKEDVKEIREYNLKVFKVKVEVLKGLETGAIDPFSVMKKELMKLNSRGVRPVVIIDELQALDHIYMNGQRELITELFNFFVAMTKERHLAHVIISSSDGYFIDTIYKDSRLKKTSSFFKVDYLSGEDVREWLGNLEKYSKIKDYRLAEGEIEKIWDVVGGSMWEIQKILTDLFNKDLDAVLEEYKKSMRAIIDDYIGFSEEKEAVLRMFADRAERSRSDLKGRCDLPNEELEEILHNLVSNNILYYDPTEALFYPQGKSMEWGVRLYFERSTHHA